MNTDNGPSGPAGRDGPDRQLTGKTVADVLDSLFSNPRRWFALMGLLAGLAGLVMLVMFVFTRLFGVETQVFQIGGANTHILFSSVEKRSGNEEYVVVVNPQGWQRTDIEVQPGDQLSFSADGKVCIDLNDILEKVARRLKYEDEHAKELKIRPNDPTETRVPEDYFTPDERKSLVLNRPWVGPDGFDLENFQPAFRSRRGRYLMPHKNAAGLVAAVKAGSKAQPAPSDAFFVGKSKSCVVGDEDCGALQKGWLWFTVNDVQYNDPDNPVLFYNDNIGVFWVRVTVKHG
jgi:hypothetical protein